VEQDQGLAALREHAGDPLLEGFEVEAEHVLEEPGESGDLAHRGSVGLLWPSREGYRG
jgi:hypothetical protein